MRDHNPLSPWNPKVPAEITPTEFEKIVLAWLRKCGLSDNQEIEVKHLGTIEGGGGEYKIDILVKFTVFSGAEVIVECEHQGRPIEREDTMVLEAKLRDAAAHKGMLFSTSGFQKGALQYATAHGIATIAVVNGKWLYETKSAGSTSVEPPPWVRFDSYAGIRMTSTDGGISSQSTWSEWMPSRSGFCLPYKCFNRRAEASELVKSGKMGTRQTRATADP